MIDNFVRLGRSTATILLVLFGISAATPALAQTIDSPAREAILIDADTDAVLFAKNPDQLTPPSSMSKLMTVHMVFERLAAGTLKLEDKLTVSQNAWKKGGAASGGSTMFLNIGERVSVIDLLRGIIVQSGNDACIVIAEGLAGTEERFAEQMTRRGRELGLTNSTFKNSSGLPDPEHLMTARDLALLAKHSIIQFPEFYGIYSERDFTHNKIKQGNRNPLLYKSIGVDGLKTGHTEAAGFGLTASAKRGDRRLILVINGLRSMNERSQEGQRLFEIGFRDFDNYKLFSAGTQMVEADVWLGLEAKVPLVAAQDLTLTLPRVSRPGLKVTMIYNNPLPAPIKRGAALGRLVIAAPNVPAMEVPLIAGVDVDQLGYFARIKAALAYLVWGGKKR